MSLLPPVTSDELATLHAKTIIVTGGASGIGKATVTIAHRAGANVVIADMNKEAGEQFAAELKERAIFVLTDVSKWDSVMALFETTYAKFKYIDAVYANAGIHGFEGLLENELDDAGKLKEPSMKSIEINLHGVLYTAKAAIHFFEKNPELKHQLVITGSAASLIDTPPLFNYCAAKAGVLGLMRGLRSVLPEKNISINMIAPWMTMSPMMPQFIVDLWAHPTALPANDTDGVARALLIPVVRPELNGRTIWVAGNDAVELEEPLHKSQHLWMGKDLSTAVNEGQLRMGVKSDF
ncbi:Tropinone reductase-like [Lachnellula hyalina]|uniref:Tropinone reductase-like n=1 Tax=Lachnellula hyalina TaxID=1316788 RepID=A0A8H8QZK9_9HELO|nr:Tropinone reductase-like [Lachnellula hyalina]TVY25649.1 Tropinone reductase-like [Lachnellula hyalina]